MGRFKNDILNVNILYYSKPFRDYAFNTNEIAPQEVVMKLQEGVREGIVKDFCIYGFANYNGYIDGGEKINIGDLVYHTKWTKPTSDKEWNNRYNKELKYEQKTNTQGNFDTSIKTGVVEQFSSTTACA